MLLVGLGFAVNFGIELISEKQKTENALSTLGDASMRLALDHALSSNFTGMENALEVAEMAKVSEHRQQLIRLCSKLYSSDDKNYEDLVSQLKLLDSEAKTKKEKIATKALLANAAIWSGTYLDLHYQQLLDLHSELPQILDQRQELDLEGKVFLGQAFGPIIPEIGLQLLEPAYEETQSPAIRLLLAQAKFELVNDKPSSELARQAYNDANAAYLFLPQSAMANALRTIALHTAWRHDLDGIKQWYLDEAWRMVERTDIDAIHPGGIFAADFLGAADLPNSVSLFWSMLRNGRVMPNVPGYLVFHSPEQYCEILDVLEARIDSGDDQAWGGIPNSVLLLKAMDAVQHVDLARALSDIDENHQQIIGADPRFFGLLAGLIVEGRSGENVRRLAESFNRYPPLQEIYFAKDAPNYILGTTSEAKFLELNQSSPRSLAMAESLVAFAKIGDRDRVGAIAHLQKAMEIPTSISSLRGIVSAFHRLLTENHELVEWVLKQEEPSLIARPIQGN